MEKLFIAQIVSALLAASASAQVLLSGGTYSQTFDFPALEQTANPNTNWVNNSDILGWYAETSFGVVTNYRVSSGGVNNGSVYSFGTTGSAERALGAIPSGTYNGVTHGLRMQNDTANTIGSFTIGYTGEQWRNGGPAGSLLNTLAFSYRIDSLAITSPDWANAGTWAPITALDFVSPITSTTAAALDGNLPANRITLSATISGLSMTPGQEVFFRWYDINDTSNDHGLAVDDLTVSYTTVAVPEPTTAALLGMGLLAFCNRIRSSNRS